MQITDVRVRIVDGNAKMKAVAICCNAEQENAKW